MAPTCSHAGEHAAIFLRSALVWPITSVPRCQLKSSRVNDASFEQRSHSSDMQRKLGIHRHQISHTNTNAAEN